MKIDMKPMCKLKSYGSDDVATDDDGDFSRTMMIKQGWYQAPGTKSQPTETAPN